MSKLIFVFLQIISLAYAFMGDGKGTETDGGVVVLN